MSHIKLVVDDEILVDENLDTWQDRAKPGFVKDLLNPSGPPQVHMMAAALVLSQLALADKSGVITIATDGLDQWSLTVKKT